VKETIALVILIRISLEDNVRPMRNENAEGLNSFK
jgi:hypothetical protein